MTKNVTLETEKLAIIKWVTSLKDETAIERLKMLRDKTTPKDWWNEVAEEEQVAIDKGLADIKAGRIKPHKEVQKLYVKYL